MATGNMAGSQFRKVTAHSTCLLVLCLAAAGAGAQEVGLAGIMGSKALLTINGGDPRTVALGQTVDGVKVLAIQGDQAIVEIGGKKRPLRVGQHAIGTPATPAGSASIPAAARRL